MPKICDNKSVGIIVKNSAGQYLIILRKNFPQMYACVAGHIDDHGSPAQAATDEMQEEVGVLKIPLKLLLEKEYQNPCRREGGTHHFWSIFEGYYDGPIAAGSDARSAFWKTAEELKSLISRTKDYRAGKIDESDWQKNPGFEDAWVNIFEDLHIF